MKILKKISYILLIVALLSSQIVIPDFVQEAEAKSLNDYKAELEALKKDYADNQAKQEATEEEMGNAKEQITKLSEEKEKLEQEIESLNAEIEQLENDIISKNEEMKGIIHYYQLSSTGEDAYLEYLFTATDFTDFIYRMAIAEQLSDYNEGLIDDYNKLITKNEKKKEELSNKIVQLDKKTLELEGTVSDLQIELKAGMEGAMDIEDEIELISKKIKEYEILYEEFDCDADMEYKKCLAKSNTLPAGTAFYRPVVSGRVSSNWGKRSFILNGKPYSDFHYGIDFSASHGSKVYSAANGKVVATIDAKASYKKNGKKVCGGSKIYVVHNINGKEYTTAYYHLASIKVKVGQAVTYDTVIGTVGGSPSIEYWDNCSTGSHLHFQIATGHYLSDYMTYSGFTSKSFNPRKVLNAPALGSSFNNRKTKY